MKSAGDKMNAKQLKDLTDEVNTPFNEISYTRYIIHCMLESALEGNYSYYSRGVIKDTVKLELKALGYTVEVDEIGMHVTISWRYN